MLFNFIIIVPIVLTTNALQQCGRFRFCPVINLWQTPHLKYRFRSITHCHFNNQCHEFWIWLPENWTPCSFRSNDQPHSDQSPVKRNIQWQKKYSPLKKQSFLRSILHGQLAYQCYDKKYLTSERLFSQPQTRKQVRLWQPKEGIL